MPRLFLLLAPALLLLAGCVTTGPDRTDLAQALQAQPAALSAVRCNGIPEEPTEYACRYRSRDAGGRWTPEEAVIAADGSAWVVIDGPVPR